MCSLLPHPLIADEFVHATGPQSCPHSIDDCHAGIDVADQLGFALTGVCALLEQDDLGLLQVAEQHQDMSHTVQHLQIYRQPHRYRIS